MEDKNSVGKARQASALKKGKAVLPKAKGLEVHRVAKLKGLGNVRTRRKVVEGEDPP